MNPSDRIFVAGHQGMVGSALLRSLKARGYHFLLTPPRSRVDLRDSHQVEKWFTEQRPDYVFLAAARVGGIQANRQYPAEFIYDNLMIQNNVIDQAYRSGVKKLLFLGSSCVYPRECPQPIKEEYLLTGPLEPTNEAYALAKIAGLKMAQYYHRQYGFQSVCPMPCNLYGDNDSFDPLQSHVFSALIRKFVNAVDTAKDEVVLWGSGSARREFLHVRDLSEAVLLLMEHWHSPDIINVGSGFDVTIRELAEQIAEATGYRGRVVWDCSIPDGMPRKCLDISRISQLGFRPSISLTEGIRLMIAEYRRFIATHPPAAETGEKAI